MAWIPVRPVIATRKVPAAHANPMATSLPARVDLVVHGQVAHVRAVRARVARVPMVIVALAAVPVIAVRVAKAATVLARAKVVQHVPRARTDIRAMPRISPPITPIRAASTRMANARAATALPAIARARDRAQVVRAVRSRVAHVDRNQVVHAAVIAETERSQQSNKGADGALVVSAMRALSRGMQRCGPSACLAGRR